VQLIQSATGLRIDILPIVQQNQTGRHCVMGMSLTFGKYGMADVEITEQLKDALRAYRREHDVRFRQRKTSL